MTHIRLFTILPYRCSQNGVGRSQGIVEVLGLNGIGQHSGAIGVRSDFLGLPRHPFYTGADDLDRFSTRVRTVPLYIEALPPGPLRVSSTSRVTLTLSETNISSVNCFFDGVSVNIQENKIVDLGPFKERRTKLNCTMPLREGHGAGVFGWWSYLFIKP